MGGFLVPPWFKEQEVTEEVMNIASIFWGFSLSFAIFAGSKATKQTVQTWHRAHRFTAYIYMIWGHWLANNILAIINWLYLWGTIEASFWLWFFILVIWVFQTQLIVQIIINRISLLMMVQRKARQLKWAVFAILAVINISVFVIWIPTRLQISPTWIRIDGVWDRIEKGIFLIVDAALNTYFVYLVRSRLISNGLTKYTRLYHFNLAMISLSVSVDIALIGMMSMPNAVLYIQFQSVAYLLKLYIEMKMADLIKKVVLASNIEDIALTSDTGKSRVKGTDSKSAERRNNNKFLATISRGANQPYGGTHTAHVELGSDDSINIGRDIRSPQIFDENVTGIQMTTVVTQVVHRKGDEGSVTASGSDSDSVTSSNSDGDLRPCADAGQS
ncbi:hypothetical protein F5Y15DRAFT_101365 [Xylariaceae sp. FL0016]|nr:hypothetical protein F5Y15DRAFT_101365 [Xylariaceae sp. FL0016]